MNRWWKPEGGEGSRIKLSVTVLLGLGGPIWGAACPGYRQDPFRHRPGFCQRPDPDGGPGTPLDEDMKAGRFQLPSPFELLEELGTIVAHSNFSRCYFTSNHASNYLPIKARMPRDKEAVVNLIQKVTQSKDRSSCAGIPAGTIKTLFKRNAILRLSV
jgi:hypothetical protein